MRRDGGLAALSLGVATERPDEFVTDLCDATGENLRKVSR
jgi:hypothetical protein